MYYWITINILSLKKKQYEQQLPKEKLKEKLKHHKELYQQSLKEYTLIKKSIYMDHKKKANYSDDDGFQYNCVPKKFTQSEVDEILRTQYKDKTEEELFGCGKCINKMLYSECDENCRCGVSCRKRRFQNKEYAYVLSDKNKR